MNLSQSSSVPPPISVTHSLGAMLLQWPLEAKFGSLCQGQLLLDGRHAVCKRSNNGGALRAIQKEPCYLPWDELP